MGKPKKEVVVINKEPKAIIPQGNSPADMIRMAVAGGGNLEQLKGLLDLQERYEANQARKAYHQAMAEFKANPPQIDKDKTVSYSTNAGTVKYNHASLYNVVEKISAELSKHGLSASWTTKQNGVIMVTCKITHVQGHSEETTLSAEADKSGSKNSIQAIGSTITYLERYTLLGLTGLATFEDDDGKGADIPIEYISDKELSQIIDCLNLLKRTEKSFCAILKIETLKKLPSASFQKAMDIIKIEAERTGVKLC